MVPPDASSSPPPDPPGGVYGSLRPPVTPYLEYASVPAFGSVAFWRFLGGFLRAPAENPVFKLAWSPIQRRLHWTSLTLTGVAALAGLAGGLVTGALFAVLAAENRNAATVFYYAVAVAGHGGLVLWSLVSGLSATRRLEAQATREQLVMTPLRADEVAWGLEGARAFVFSAAGLALWPSVLVMALLLALGEPPAGHPASPALAMSLAVLFWPHLAASIFLAGALSIAVTYSSGNLGLLRVGLAAAGVGLLIWVPLGCAGALAWPWVFVVVLPLATVVKFALGAALLQFLARRVAERWWSE